MIEKAKLKMPSRVVIKKVQSLKSKKGEVAVIDPESGDYFIAKTLTEALKKAKKKYPQRIFYSVRIGYDFVHQHKGCLQRA